MSIRLLVLLALLWWPPQLAGAADGDLLTSFGSGGVVIEDLGLGASDFGESLAVQADGKIVVVGTINTGLETDAFLARLLPTGALDPAFGSGGLVVADWSPGDDDYGMDVVVQPDGKILAVGTRGEEAMAIARYEADGSPDGTFGTGGLALADFGPAYETAVAGLLQPDGKVVLVGWGDPQGSSDFLLARFTSAGVLDSEFGTGGLVATDFSGAGSLDAASGAALSADGTIVAVGLSDAAAFTRFALARYSAGGELDTAFGSGGLVADGYPVASAGRDAVLQPDGRIVVLGEGPPGSNTAFAVARYLADGSIDPSFGFDGYLAVDFSPQGESRDKGRGLVIQPDGRIVLAGWSEFVHPVTAQHRTDLAVSRLLPGGALDPTFGVGGQVLHDLPGNATPDGAAGLARRADGGLLAVGWSGPPPYDVTLAALESATELIFADGFESGSTASWSATAELRLRRRPRAW